MSAVRFRAVRNATPDLAREHESTRWRGSLSSRVDAVSVCLRHVTYPLTVVRHRDNLLTRAHTKLGHENKHQLIFYLSFVDSLE